MLGPDANPLSDDHLVIETRCPECGGPVEARLWHYSGYCGYCGSLLVFGGTLDEERFVVSDARSTEEDLIALLVDFEASKYRGKLEARERTSETLTLADAPAVVDARVEQFARTLRAELELRERVDFFVPYRVIEKTVVQGVLGRRRGIKESFVQSFYTEELERLYDPDAFHLRDRGLKIQGFRLRRLADLHLDFAENRFLPTVEPGDSEDPSALRTFDRAKMRLDPGTQIITKVAGNWRERRLTTYKHLTYAHVAQRGAARHLIFDRQFGTVAARLGENEARTYRALAGRDLATVIPRPRVRTVASECPDCGWELRIPERERVSFCATCKHAVRVDAKGLALVRYQAAPLPQTRRGESLLVYPFWAFAFRLRAQGVEYRRIWDWLEALSPQTHLIRHRQTDPPESRLFVPARDLHGARPLDEAFAQLTGWANWAQPETRRERPPPNETLRMLGAELTGDEAAGLARYALLALHDNASTRRLNARSFAAMIAEAELALGPAELVALPLRLVGDAWKVEGLRAVPAPVLESGTGLPRVTRSFSLR